MLDSNSIALKVAEVDNTCQGNDTMLRSRLGDLSLSYLDFEVDILTPNDASYRKRQLEIYSQVSGREYSISNEEIPFDLESAILRPHPFNGSNIGVASEHFMTLGFILQNINLPLGSKIFEMGAGWGNLSLTLAKIGYKVGACDLEHRFVELVRRRAELEKVNIMIDEADFFNSPCFNPSEEWDAIIFNSCFHHCDNPLRLLDRLVNETSQSTKLIFAGESIYESYPWPWGLNLHGQAVYCINKFGWLELAFNESFFIRSLQHRGLTVRKHTAPHDANMTLFIASKIESYSDDFVPFHDLCQPPEFRRTYADEGFDSSEIGRWTSAQSEFIITDPNLICFNLLLANHKPCTSTVTISRNNQAPITLNIGPGEKESVEINHYKSEVITIRASVDNPFVNGWSTDNRNLGIYIMGIEISSYFKKQKSEARAKSIRQQQ
jgi:protein-L-isoaspartate O-methyltransferase